MKLILIVACIALSAFAANNAATIVLSSGTNTSECVVTVDVGATNSLSADAAAGEKVLLSLGFGFTTGSGVGLADHAAVNCMFTANATPTFATADACSCALVEFDTTTTYTAISGATFTCAITGAGAADFGATVFTVTFDPVAALDAVGANRNWNKWTTIGTTWTVASAAAEASTVTVTTYPTSPANDPALTATGTCSALTSITELSGNGGSGPSPSASYVAAGSVLASSFFF